MSGAMARRHRQVAEVLAVMAAFAVVAYAVVSTGQPAEQGTVLVSKENGRFRSMWDGWLHKVENQVEAAVDLSHGLSKSKDEKLNRLLENDLKHDATKEKKMINSFDGSSDSARVKKAVRSAINKKPSSAHKVSPKAASKAVRAAVKAVTSQVKSAKVVKEDKSERSKPVPPAGRNVISPFSKHVENAVFRDDQKVAREEAKVKQEENQLMADEGVHQSKHQSKQARARHAIHAATKGLQMASKPLKQAQKPTKPINSAAAKKISSAHAKSSGDSISAMKAMDDKMEAEATIPAEGASAEMAKVMGNAKDLKFMQGALAAVLQKTDKDPEAAKEAKEEEKSWGGLLKNWGISR